MYAETITVLRAVAPDLCFNCWCLEIPSDIRIRHMILDNNSEKIKYFHVYGLIIHGVRLVTGFIDFFTYHTTALLGSSLHTCSHVFTAVTW
jgi:hypothetical protein